LALESRGWLLNQVARNIDRVNPKSSSPAKPKTIARFLQIAQLAFA
jgi:hypothetical protein